MRLIFASVVATSLALLAGSVSASLAAAHKDEGLFAVVHHHGRHPHHHHQQKCFDPRVLRSKKQQQIVALRGGAGPLDQKVVANVATCIYLVRGLVGTLAGGGTAINRYCGGGLLPAETSSKLNLLAVHRAGVAALSVAVLSIVSTRHQHLGMPMNAFFAALPMVLEGLGSVFDPSINKEAGVEPQHGYPMTALAAFTVYATYFGKYDDAAVKIFTWFCIALGLSLFPFPEFGVKYSIASGATEETVYLIGSMGAWMLGLGLQLWGLGHGKSAKQAVGYAVIPPVLHGLRALVLTGQAKRLGIPQNAAIFGLLLGAVIVGTLVV